MFLKLRPLIFSLVFLCGLELIIFRPDYTGIILLFFIIASLYEGRLIGGKWFFAVLPVFSSLSSIALLFFITLPYEQHIFIVAASAMHYLVLFSAYRLGLYRKDQTARGMNMAASASVIFFTYAASYGFYLNFLVPLYYLMLVYLISTFLISHQYFSLLENDNKKTLLTYSLLLSLLMAEIIWAMNFWPFGYLTTGVSALILYYVLWDLARSHFQNLLNKKRVVVNMVFFLIMITLVLLSSKWIPVI